MKSKISLIVMALILVLPVTFYAVFKAPATNAKSVNNQPVVMEFFMPLCSECQKLEKVVTVVKPQYDSKISFVTINAANMDKETLEKVHQYNVKVVPTTVFFDKKGKIIGRAEGSMTESQLKEFLDETLK